MGRVGHQFAQAGAAVHPSDVEPALPQASHHVEIEHERGPVQGPRRAAGVVSRSEEPQLLAGEGREHQSARRATSVAEAAGQGENRRRSRGVIVRSVVDRLIRGRMLRALPAAPEMIVMRPDHDRLRREARIGAGEDPDDVGGRPIRGGERLEMAAAVAPRPQPGVPEDPRDVSGRALRSRRCPRPGPPSPGRPGS